MHSSPTPVNQPGKNRSRYRTAIEISVCMVVGFLLWCASLQDWGIDNSGSLPPYFETLSVIDFLVGVIASLSVGVARNSPRRNLALIAACSLSSWAIPAGIIGLWRLGRANTRIQIQGFVLWCFASASASLLDAPKRGLHWVDFFATAIVSMFGASLILWSRNRTNEARLLNSLHDQAETAIRERDALSRERAALEHSLNADIARVRAEERTAIAREMHDSLSHHLSLIALHSGALAYRDDLSQTQVHETSRTLQDAARAANEDLREVLLALRGQHEPVSVEGSTTTPLPTSETVFQLIEDARERGQRISLQLQDIDEKSLKTLSASTVSALHRTVAEVLNNARKYAPHEVVTLTIARVDGLLVIRAHNQIPKSAHSALGTGMGLIGVEERAKLLGGGSLTHTDSAGYTVEVHLPWRSKEQP